MHILEFKINYKPEVAAGIEIDANTAEDLAMNGHFVHLYIPRPSRGISKEIAKKTPIEEELIDGKLMIRRYRMYAEGKSFSQRLIRYCFCSIKQLWFGCKEKNVDLIFAGSTPPFQGIICSILKKRKQVPFVYNCQDIFPDSMVVAGLIKEKSFLYRIGERISSKTYKAADRIIVISDEMKKTLIQKGVPEEKIKIVYNWIDENVIHPIDINQNKLLTELGVPRYNFTVVYAGNIGYAQGMDIILEAAEQLKENKEIGFIIFGNGALEDKMKEDVKKRGIDNICFFPLQPYNRVSEVYSIGNACIVSCKEGTGGFAMPSKTWSIMGCGRPVLASFDIGTRLERIIKDEECGLFSQAGDVKGLVTNILALKDNRQLASQLGKNGREYIEKNLSRELGTKKIVEIIESTYSAQ